jgi:hypothetical protein
MICEKPVRESSGIDFTCDEVYCPLNATHPEYGSFTASACFYTKYFTNSSTQVKVEILVCNGTTVNIPAA